jgi:hypothetical protein
MATAEYLVVVRERQKAARLFNTDIFKATDFALYPLEVTPSGSASYLSDASKEEAYLLDLLKSHLTTASFYFANGGPYDVTTRLQAQSSSSDGPLWERADDRFFWNKFLLSRLIESTTRGSHDVRMSCLSVNRTDNPLQLSRFITPVVLGCEGHSGVRPRS